MKPIFVLFLFLAVRFITSQDTEIIWVDDFEDNVVGIFPDDWKGRKKKARKFYMTVLDTLKGDHVLLAHSRNTDMFVLKKIKVDIVKYPFLNWKWRAIDLPPNGDESVKKYCDVVASVNVVLVAKFWNPKSIKYSWSTTLPRYTETKSPYAHWPARTDIVVLQSGDEKKGQWISEKVNVLSDYKKLYNKKKVKSFVIKAIVIMTDSDNTKSITSAQYDDFFFSKE